MPGRDAEKEKRRIISVVSAYLDEAAHDASRPLTFAGIARECGISRGHFAKDDEDFKALAQRVVQLRAAHGGGRAPRLPQAEAARPTLDELRARSHAGPDRNAAEYADDELDARIQGEVRRAGEMMRRWLGYARSSKGARDSVLLARDLESTIAGLHAVHARLRPLASEKEDRILGEDAPL